MRLGYLVVYTSIKRRGEGRREGEGEGEGEVRVLKCISSKRKGKLWLDANNTNTDIFSTKNRRKYGNDDIAPVGRQECRCLHLLISTRTARPTTHNKSDLQKNHSRFPHYTPYVSVMTWRRLLLVLSRCLLQKVREGIRVLV